MQQIEKTYTTQVNELEFERNESAGQVIPVRPAIEYEILPPSANATKAPDQVTYTEVVRWFCALAIGLVAVGMAWQLVTVILPAFFAGIAEGVKAGGAVAGEWISMAMGGLFVLVLIAIGLAFLSGIRFTGSDSSDSKKTVINNYHNTTNFNSNNHL